MKMSTPAENTSASPPDNANGNKRRGKKRIRSFTTDERACHSAIEKQRREVLNASFIDLARLVPALALVHRLSKALIVQETIHHLEAQREMGFATTNEIRVILAENKELVADINTWRKGYGVIKAVPHKVAPLSDALRKLQELVKQVYDTLPAGFGDNGPGEGYNETKVVESAGRSQVEMPINIMQVVFSSSTIPVMDLSPNLHEDFPKYTFL